MKCHNIAKESANTKSPPQESNKKNKFKEILEEGQVEGIIPISPLPNALEISKNISSTKAVPSCVRVIEGILKISQKIPGVTRIDLSLNMRELKGIGILLEHYDTAPGSINITIVGDPDVATILHESSKDLESKLSNSFSSISFRVLKSISSKKKHLVKSKKLVYLVGGSNCEEFSDR